MSDHSETSQFLSQGDDLVISAHCRLSLASLNMSGLSHHVRLSMFLVNSVIAVVSDSVMILKWLQ